MTQSIQYRWRRVLTVPSGRWPNLLLHSHLPPSLSGKYIPKTRNSKKVCLLSSSTLTQLRSHAQSGAQRKPNRRVLSLCLWCSTECPNHVSDLNCVHLPSLMCQLFHSLICLALVVMSSMPFVSLFIVLRPTRVLPYHPRWSRLFSCPVLQRLQPQPSPVLRALRQLPVPPQALRVVYPLLLIRRLFPQHAGWILAAGSHHRQYKRSSW